MKYNIPSRIERFETYIKEQIDLAGQMLKAHNGALYPFDIYTSAIINRSIFLLKGFICLLRDRNFICATPLIRLQLDNLMRLYAGFIVSEPHSFAMSVINGERIDEMKDKNGKKMRDAYLKEELSKQYDWIKRVYKDTSGFIHFSEKHIYSSAKFSQNNDGTVKIQQSIGPVSENTTDDYHLDLISDGMEKVTDILNNYIEGWIITKDNPRLIKLIKEYKDKFDKD